MIHPRKKIFITFITLLFGIPVAESQEMSVLKFDQTVESGESGKQTEIKVPSSDDQINPQMNPEEEPQTRSLQTIPDQGAPKSPPALDAGAQKSLIDRIKGCCSSPKN